MNQTRFDVSVCPQTETFKGILALCSFGLGTGRKIGQTGWIIFYFCLNISAAYAASSPNPHRMLSNQEGCNLCHASPDFSQGGKLCLSCHHCSLAGDSSLCLNCHESHGTAEVTGLLKKEWAAAEIDKSSWNPHNSKGDCLACHQYQPKDKANPGLKSGGDINSLCRTCHAGASCRHPVGIAIPTYMRRPEGLPLSPEGKIICTTCHRLDCRGDGSIYFIGFSRRQGLQGNDLCQRCHRIPVDANPHTHAARQQNCRTCHAFSPQANRIRADYTLLTDSRLVCLRCHPERPHPAQDDHHRTVPPKKGLDIKNLKLDNLGRITCITCHNPHVAPQLPCASNTGCADCHKEYF